MRKSPTFTSRENRFFTLLMILAILVSFSHRVEAADENTHPLDPLTKEEIKMAVEILKASGKTTTSSRFSLIVLREPSKAEVLNYKPGDPLRREAFIIVFDRAPNKTFEAVVDLHQRSVTSWKEIPGVQPSLFLEDVFITQAVVKADLQWQEAMRKRGITDFNSVQIEPWPAGNFGFPEEQGIRVLRAVSFLRGKATNPHARPIEGVLAYVDLTNNKVFKLIDTGVVPVPQATADLDMQSIGQQREAVKPLSITQPQGLSFDVRGNEVRWQGWRFRFALHPRDGLTLYMVRYEDQGKERSILYRAALSEMVVPYGDPSPLWFFRNAFDEGEFGMGKAALSLEPNVDAPANAVFFHPVLSNESGGSQELKNGIALYERDGGVLWKHVDYMTGRNQSRRARQLVLSSFSNLGNYEYGFNWVFHQDGTLEMEALLTGIMAIKGVNPEHANHSAHGHLVAEGIEAVHHQHIFNFRLDFDIEGQSNSILELDTEALPSGKNNPYHNAFTTKETILRSEAEGRRQVNLAASRKWKVFNPKVKNALGQPAGYLIIPGENSIAYAGLNAVVRKRAGFIGAHLWATQFDANEMNAAGAYVPQSRGGDGLPKWIMANRSLENRDVVLWYTMGITHIPRPEEWPVMTVHKAGFKLIPSSFFSRNPALDVPKP